MLKKLLSQNKSLLEKLTKTFKINGVGLIFGLVVLGFSVLSSHALYHPKNIVKRGFEIEIKTAEQIAAEKNAPKVIIDIAQMIANADLKAGAKVFKKCASCHTANKGGANKVGPNLYAVIGRNKASLSGFSYSDAMKEKGGIWSIKDLNQWLKKPKDFIPKNKMAFAGLKKDKDRANVIAYLKQQAK
ncbi:MAG: cytochrome c [Rickettsiales bacterium]|jgi:cytochrome c